MIRVTIFEDYKDMRESLSQLIEETDGLLLCGAYPNAMDALNVISKQKPDVILMDLQMPGISGIEAIRIIKNHYPQIQILVQSMYDDNERVFAALCMGASGYILKSTSIDKISQAIIDVYNGGSPMSPAIARKMLTTFQENQAISTNQQYCELSNRERVILNLLAKGLSYKMIANACDISYGTVNSHLKKIYEKLHVHSATEAVQKALIQKIVTL
jgi:DNA-binding NarL/FixJ family response regulator